MEVCVQRSAWVAQVDRRLSRWCITLSDMGFDEEEVAGLWRSGEAPDAFVERITEKYALIPFEPLRP
jgi:hypothetical protein